MKSYEEEMADWQQARARCEAEIATAMAAQADFAMMEVPEGMAVRRQFTLPTQPPRPLYHAWPPPPDATLLERFDRAHGHLHEKVAPFVVDGYAPLLGVIRELVAEVERLAALRAEEARPKLQPRLPG